MTPHPESSPEPRAERVDPRFLAEGTTEFDMEPYPDDHPLSYRLARDNPLRKVELQCSSYDGGKRWCDWCSAQVFPKAPKHKETCPIYQLDRLLKGESLNA